MRGEELHDRVKELEQQWLQNNVQQLITGSISSILIRTHNSPDAPDQSNERREAGEKFLAALKDAWEDHQLCMGMVTDVLMYMVSKSIWVGFTLGIGLISCAGPHDLGLSHQAFDLCRLHGTLP